MKTIWFFLKPYKLYVAVLLGLCLVNGILETLHMALLYPILNASLERGIGLSDNPFLEVLNKVAEILPVDDVLISNCILFAILTVVYSACRLLYMNLSPRVGAKIVREHEQKVFRKYAESDYRFFADMKQGDLIYKGSQASQFIGNTVNALSISLVEILLSVFVLFLLISISWKSTIAVIIAGAGYYYFTQYLSKRIAYVAGRGMRRGIEDENVLMNEYITGVKQIRASVSSEHWQKEFDRASASRWKHWAKSMFWNQVPNRILELLLFASVAIVVIAIKLKYPDEFFSMIPLFGTFAFALLKLLPKLSSVGTMLMNVANWLPNLEAVRELLMDETYNKIKNGTAEFQQFKAAIDFRNVSFAYTGRESTLTDISLVINKDSMTAIVGPSGSGKSTLADLLLRLYDVDKGEILIDGRNITNYDIATFLARVGFVGQETFVFNASVRENITFGHKYSDEEIISAARLANAHEFVERLPSGYDTVVGDRGLKLSGGEKQRIAIARAMIRKPQIMILDEATSSLDNVSEKIVQKAIDKVSESCTTLVIAHRLSTVQNADIIYVIDQGRIVESGSQKELVDNRGKYWELFTTQESGSDGAGPTQQNFL